MTSSEELILTAKRIANSIGVLQSQVVQEQPVSNVGEQLERAQLEAELLASVGKLLAQYDADKQRMRAQLRRLGEENSWLREELADCRERLERSEAHVVELEEDRKTHAFTCELRRYEREQSGTAVPLASESESTRNRNMSERSCGETVEEEAERESGRAGDGGTSNVTAATTGARGSDNGTKEVVKQKGNERSRLVSGEGDGEAGGEYELPARLRTLQSLVASYVAQGRFEVAVPLCRQALDEVRRVNGPEHPDVAAMCTLLATVQRDRGALAEAVAALNEALTIRERSFGPQSACVASTLNNLAVLHGRLGEFGQAEPLCKRALQIREHTLGPAHPDVAKQLNNLALICVQQGHFAEAQECYARALRVSTTAYGEAHPATLKTAFNLANALSKQSRLAEADELYRDILVRLMYRCVADWRGEEQRTQMDDGVDVCGMPETVVEPFANLARMCVKALVTVYRNAAQCSGARKPEPDAVAYCSALLAELFDKVVLHTLTLASPGTLLEPLAQPTVWRVLTAASFLRADEPGAREATEHRFALLRDVQLLLSRAEALGRSKSVAANLGAAENDDDDDDFAIDQPMASRSAQNADNSQMKRSASLFRIRDSIKRNAANLVQRFVNANRTAAPSNSPPHSTSVLARFSANAAPAVLSRSATEQASTPTGQVELNPSLAKLIQYGFGEEPNDDAAMKRATSMCAISVNKPALL